jgi:hypothetical protein
MLLVEVLEGTEGELAVAVVLNDDDDDKACMPGTGDDCVDEGEADTTADPAADEDDDADDDADDDDDVDGAVVEGSTTVEEGE